MKKKSDELHKNKTGSQDTNNIDKRAEKSQLEDAEKYQNILKNIHDGCFELDLAGNFTFFNDSACRILGYSREELMGMNYRHYTDKENAKKVSEAYLKVYNTGEPSKGFNWEVTRKDGAKRYIETSVSLQKDLSGKPTGFIGIVNDITERKQADEELKESENKYRLLADNVDDVIFVLDMNLNFTYVSPSVKILIGYEQEEFLKLRVSETMTPSSWDLATKNLSKELEKYEQGDSPKLQSLQLEMRRKDGSTVWTEVKASFIRDENQLPVGIIGVTRDITDRRQVEKALHESEEKYRTILENIQEGYFEVDLTGNFTFFNDSICRILGYSQEEMMGMNNRQYTDKEHSKILYQAFNNVYSTGKPAKEFDWQIIRKDGTKRYIEISVSLQNNSSGKPSGFRGIARDITERKMMEEEILALSITDQLTGLYNRRGFLSLAEQQLKLAKRNKSGMLLFFIDMDELKGINDKLGHEEGDKALIETATLFKETFRASDIIARLGGDEYAALAIEITETNCEIITRRLQSLVDIRNNQENRRYRLSISVGCSYYDPENPCSIDDLIERADKLMYEQKKNKKSRLPQVSALSNGNPQLF